jgi:hypothetical protein
MTMYLSNHEVRPTGAELSEFIDVAHRPDAAAATRPVDAIRKLTARENNDGAPHANLEPGA